MRAGRVLGCLGSVGVSGQIVVAVCVHAVVLLARLLRRIDVDYGHVQVP